MAEALREAYADVFAAKQDAQSMAPGELKGLFARLSDKGDAVATKMASTFKAFADLADWSVRAPESVEEEPVEVVDTRQVSSGSVAGIAMHHDIHVHLPISTDIAVYDAIFRSIKQHLSD